MQIDPSDVQEDLLYYVWKLKRFDHSDLTTTSEETIQVLDPGKHNFDSGPDFTFARVKIGDRLWVGNVEMHVRSSDWLRHGHQHDDAYANVILHVVLDDDEKIELPNGEPLACLALGERIDPGLITSYQDLMEAESWIPCEKNERPISDIALKSWYQRILVERILNRATTLERILEDTRHDWEEAFYRLMFRSFGFKVNADAFEALATCTPRKILIRHRDRIHRLEALLYGQAGFLDGTFEDRYPNDLKQDYTFLRTKYQLTPLQPQQWKFMRMRPVNFPTVRIAQLAVLLYKTTHLFSRVLAARSITEIRNMFESQVSWYWRDHYRFDQESAKRNKKLGKSSIDLIIINTIVPVLYLYGRVHQKWTFTERALDFLEALPGEKNSIIARFKDLGFNTETAFDTQALLELKKHYCDRKRCLECSIGHSIFKESA